jgi:hypothetical protein
MVMKAVALMECQYVVEWNRETHEKEKEQKGVQYIRTC